MKARVNPNLCKTAGTCVQICPQVFKFATGNKKAFVSFDQIPERYRDDVIEASKACPEQAIEISE